MEGIHTLVPDDKRIEALIPPTVPPPPQLCPGRGQRKATTSRPRPAPPAFPSRQLCPGRGQMQAATTLSSSRPAPSAGLIMPSTPQVAAVPADTSRPTSHNKIQPPLPASVDHLPPSADHPNPSADHSTPAFANQPLPLLTSSNSPSSAINQPSLSQVDQRSPTAAPTSIDQPAPLPTSHQAALTSADQPARTSADRQSPTPADQPTPKLADQPITTPVVQQAQTPASRFTIGCWVLISVGVSGKRQRKEEFIGKMLFYDEETEELKIKWLKSNGKYYTWPEKDHVSWVDVVDVIRILPNPDITPRGHFSF